MSIYDVSLSRLDGSPLPLDQFKGKALLIVNVASFCGFTPQYSGLEKLYEDNRDRGLVVLGVPCNQFGKQEPGSPEEIATFCSTNYSVTFPLTEKVEVNGPNRHPLYQQLVATPDASGKAGDIEWNFEKFVIGADGQVVGRFRSQVAPDSEPLTRAISAALPA